MGNWAGPVRNRLPSDRPATDVSLKWYPVFAEPNEMAQRMVPNSVEPLVRPKRWSIRILIACLVVVGVLGAVMHYSTRGSRPVPLEEWIYVEDRLETAG